MSDTVIKVTNTTIPILYDLYLGCTQTTVPDNKIITTHMNDKGKPSHALLLEKFRDDLSFHAMFWNDIKIVDGIFMYHFHEIIIAYAHNRLIAGQEHLIFNQRDRYGVKLYFGKNDKDKSLYLRIYHPESNQFIFAQKFSKIECCIIARILNHYFYKGALAHELCDGSTKCNYANSGFYLTSYHI